MAATNRPRLRPSVGLVHCGEPGHLALADRGRLTPHVLTMPEAILPFLERLAGKATRADLARDFGLDSADVDALLGRLDEALLLDSPAFAAYLAGRERLPSCVGAYPADPDALRAAIDRLFDAPGGPGLSATAGEPLRAALVPHMDFGRGNVTYGWGFSGLMQATEAELFLVVATSHYSGERFNLTRKNFTTPLGTAPTDQAAVSRLITAFVAAGGTEAELFADPFAHLPEHSIELEVVILQHLAAKAGRSVRVVPLLVGSFHDCVAAGTDPATVPAIRAMVAAIRHLIEESGEPVCALISGDLAHIGPKFRDPAPVTPGAAAASALHDRRLLDAIAAADPDAYFARMVEEGDARRICGFPPTWLALSALRPASGVVRHYQQFVDPRGRESVSFAAAHFAGRRP